MLGALRCFFCRVSVSRGSSVLPEGRRDAGEAAPATTLDGLVPRPCGLVPGARRTGSPLAASTHSTKIGL